MLELWYAALLQPIGVVIITDDADRCIQKLYAARRGANDLELNNISIIRSPTDPSQLWLVKKHVPAESGIPTPESDPQSF